MLIVCSLVLFTLLLLRMRIKCNFFTKCAKSDAPIKGPKHVFNIHGIGTYRPIKMRMRSGFLLTSCCLDDLFTSISFQKSSV